MPLTEYEKEQLLDIVVLIAVSGMLQFLHFVAGAADGKALVVEQIANAPDH